MPGRTMPGRTMQRPAMQRPMARQVPRAKSRTVPWRKQSRRLPSKEARLNRLFPSWVWHLGALLLTVSLLSACETEGVTAPGESEAVLSQRDGASAPDVRILREGDIERFRFDRYRLLSMRTEGDVLVLLVSVVGDCIVHEFNLLARDRFGVFRGGAVPGSQFNAQHPPGATWPSPFEIPLPSVSLILSHDARGDLCQGRQFRELRFGLAPLRRAFARTFGVKSGTIVLTLSIGRIVYAFPAAGGATAGGA